MKDREASFAMATFYMHSIESMKREQASRERVK
jgi:hypothetical protein